ncbi:MAG TPA: MFS transporter [Chthoniobacterales bacterium]|jgi:ACS family tartrate transporter-like MFS transporter|nr:MFS transporter [Chthoniobacterales bacterium]
MTSLPTDAGTGARRRIAGRLLPFLFLLYVANYLDRTNIAYATLGMKGDLRLSDSVFGTASGIFFIGYFALQIPGALLVERWSARRLLSLTLITWGVLTTLTGFVHTAGQLYGARFLLGAAEAGFFPGVIVYLSHWFINQDRAKAMARFMAAIPIGFMIGGPIAGSILRVHWLGIAGWRWLFLLEGIPAVLLGIATLLVLPDWPDEARWLPPNERDWITQRLTEERNAKTQREHLTIWQALRHPAVLVLTAGLFFTYTGGYAFWFWFPTMLQRLTGWTNLQQIGWIGAIPFVAGLIGMLILSWSSDRTGERRWHFAIPQLTAAMAFVGWLFLPHSNTLLVLVFTLVGFGTVAYLPSFWALPSAFLSSSAAAAAVGFINCTASIGGFVGPKIFGDLSQRTGSFNTGFVFMIACFAIASLLVLICPREHVIEDTSRSQS